MEDGQSYRYIRRWEEASCNLCQTYGKTELLGIKTPVAECFQISHVYNYPNNTNRTDPTASETVLLTCQDNSGSTVPTDNSDSNHTLTKNGTITNGAGYLIIASDSGPNNLPLTVSGDVRNTRYWPFTYNG